MREMTPLDEWKRRAKYFSAGGRDLAYWTSGDEDETKPFLLLIHGYPTSSWDWNFIWDALTPQFRPVAMDMLGFGLSEKPKDVYYAIDAQADLLEAFLEYLGVGEAHVLAHDYGDTVAQEILARHNEKSLSFLLRSLTLLNGGLFPEQHRALFIQKLGISPLGFLLGKLMTRQRFEKSFSAVFGEKTKPGAAELDIHWALMTENSGLAVMHKLLSYIPQRKANRARWVGALQEAAIPVRLIDGGADPVSGSHMFNHYRESVPDADALLLSEIGHYPQTEAPDLVLNAFLEFHRRLRTIPA
ncbi:MAG: alpha/beta hydrolase [Parvularculaceae bacterium]